MPQVNHTNKVRAFVLTFLFIAIILTAIVIKLIQPPDDPFHASAIKNPPFQSLTYGVQAFMWWDTALTAGLHLDWVRLLGFTHAKQIFAWSDVEPRQGEWHFGQSDAVVDLAQSRGVQLVARLGFTPDWALPPDTPADATDTPPADLADFGRYCGALAERYTGRIRAYQVWNEPNLSREWGDQTPNAGEYVELLRVCSQAIRTADPHAIIISAGLSPTGNYDDLAHRDDLYLQAMYDHQFQQYVDVVGVHAPGWGIAPDYNPDDAEKDGRGRWATFRRVEDLRKIMLQNNDAGRQIAILEFGYTTDQENPVYSWHAVDEATQQAYMVEAYQYMADNWRPWVGLVSAIYLADPSWTPADEQYWWALNVHNERIRPVFGGLAQMPKYCGENILPARSPEESSHAPEYNPCN